MQDSQYLDIILIAMVAGFILFRLYSVLGRRTGNERPPQERYGMTGPGRKPRDNDNVVPLPDRTAQHAEANIEKPSDPLERGLLDIKLADRSFESDEFLAGARQAYEIIVTAFAAGHRKDLKPLLESDVFQAFEGVIKGREERKETVAFTFVGFKDVKVTEAEMKGRVAEVTISFATQFISATHDENGAVVNGDPKAVQEVTDVWTFARDTRSSDPNWKLIATSSGAEA